LGLKVNDKIFSGSVKFGLGYSWKKLTVDLWGNLRGGQALGFERRSSQGGWMLTYKF